MPTDMPMREAIWWTAATIAFLSLAGCGDPCDGSEERAVPLSELPCNMTKENGIWESHPIAPADEECYWFEFRGCSTYTFDHPLGYAPTSVLGYTSFDSDGGFATVGSGNSFIVEDATDSTVVIRNAQNQLFWLRLVLQ